MICAIEHSVGHGLDVVTVGMLVVTGEGELGEVCGVTFGMAAVRLLGGSVVYRAAGDVTPVRCPADVVSSEEVEALQRAA